MKFRGINRGIQPKASRVSLSLPYFCAGKSGFCVRAFVFLFSCLGCPTLSYEPSSLSNFQNFLPYNWSLVCVVVVVSLEEKDDDDEFKEEISAKR